MLHAQTVIEKPPGKHQNKRLEPLMDEEKVLECAYCGKEFDSEHERGVHQAQQHVDPDENYETKKKRQHNPYKNLVDEWKENGRGRA